MNRGSNLIILASLLVLVCLFDSLALANWFAVQANKKGLSFLANGKVDEAIKAFKEAILSYENYQKMRYSPKRAALYYNLAQAYLCKMRSFALLSRGYDYYWGKGLICAKKAVEIQQGLPEVKMYFNAGPSEWFAAKTEAASRQVQEFLRMRNLVQKFYDARRLAMFERCVNPGPSPVTNIMTIGPTEFSPAERIRALPPGAAPPPGQKGEAPTAKGSSAPSTQEGKKAQKVGQ